MNQRLGSEAHLMTPLSPPPFSKVCVGAQNSEYLNLIQAIMQLSIIKS